jgi:hypothetical protein
MRKIVLCFAVVLSLVSNSVVPVLARTFTNEEVYNFTKEDVDKLTLEDLENMTLKQVRHVSVLTSDDNGVSNLPKKFPDFYASLPPEFVYEFWLDFRLKDFNEALGRGNAPWDSFTVYYNDVMSPINVTLVDGIFFVEPIYLFRDLDIDYEYDDDTHILNVYRKFTHTVGTSYVTLENGVKLESDYNSIFYLYPMYRGSWYPMLHLGLMARALGLEMKYHAPSTSILLYSSDYEIPEENQFESDEWY